MGAGDQIDLLASLPAEGALGPASAAKSEAVTEPQLLAQNAVVLKPVYVRSEASTSASLTQGQRIQNVPKYEVAIAVKPDDLIPLQRALNQSLSITCIAHSMKPSTASATEPVVADRDTLMVPVTVHPVLAYNVVTREAFVSAATRTLKYEPLPREQVAKLDIITALDEALGAVAKHDIPAGRFLRRSDLLSGPPEQTAPASQISNHQSPDGAQRIAPDGHQFVTTTQPPATNSVPSATTVGDRSSVTVQKHKTHELQEFIQKRTLYEHLDFNVSK